jgi:4-phosphopantoate--beta-alanine ligase
MKDIPKDHPRYFSLKTREKISESMKKGITHETGLIAHGRGEAFDYLLGEKTNPFAENAIRVAAAALLLAENPVISINGNVVALNPKDCIKLANFIPAKLEVNLFHRTSNRINKIIDELKINGAKKVYGEKADALIPGLTHDRGLCDKEGIFTADVVLIPLEDGDRCQALRNMNKFIITIDLNPLSRTSRTANITIVDNVIRAIPLIEKWARKLRTIDNIKKINLEKMVESWDNKEMLNNTLQFVSKRLNSMF